MAYIQSFEFNGMTVLGVGHDRVLPDPDHLTIHEQI
jgi:hypothetical protein